VNTLTDRVREWADVADAAMSASARRDFRQLRLELARGRTVYEAICHDLRALGGSPEPATHDHLVQVVGIWQELAQNLRQWQEETRQQWERQRRASHARRCFSQAYRPTTTTVARHVRVNAR